MKNNMSSDLTKFFKEAYEDYPLFRAEWHHLNFMKRFDIMLKEMREYENNSGIR